MGNSPIYVTEPFIAPLNEYKSYLDSIWASHCLTNNGPMVVQLESRICSLLNLPNYSCTANGTIAIQMAIRALELKGEIITTPFTWIATLNAILWERCTPVFCDIDPESLNIDPTKIEEKITENTCAILPVHVFGNPVDVHAIEEIGKKYGLKIIYDAAHAFGSEINGKSILTYGDISVTSSHATKIFNTGEGGGCVSKDPELVSRLKAMRNFGLDDKSEPFVNGINAKMTELQAALGLANIKYHEQILADRKNKYELYYSLLEPASVRFPKVEHGSSNFSYLPIICESANQLQRIQRELNAENIYPRKYFYPSLNTVARLVNYTNLPISESMSGRILCLPLHYYLGENDIARICKIIVDNL